MQVARTEPLIEAEKKWYAAWLSRLVGKVRAAMIPARKPAKVMVAEVFESILALLPCKTKS